MKTWRKYRTYKRIQKLWQEYKDLAKCELTRLDIKLDKLSAFLDSFQQAYVEFKSSSNHGVSLDSFYGDCSEVLVSLLDLVDRHGSGEMKGPSAEVGGSEIASKVAEMVSQAADPVVADKVAEVIHKALSVAELILRDEKYKEITTAGPSVLCKVLSLLETVETTEAKQLALRMVASIGRSPEGKMEIGRLDGFRKVLRLMLEKDQVLSKEALTTLQHFLEVQEQEVLNGEAPPCLKQAIDEATSTSRRLGFNLSVSPSLVWDTTKKVVSTVSKLVASEGLKEREGIPAGVPVPEPSRDSKDEIDDDSVTFPPSRRIVAQKIEEIELEISKAKYAGFDMMVGSFTAMGAAADIKTPDITEADAPNNERMREFMCVQGALQTLAEKLAEAARDVQLDVMSTISKLLRNSRRAQQEFRVINGYAFVQKMFAGITDYSSPTSQVFLQDFFKIMFTIILDGSSNQAVGNLDALELVFRLVASNTHLEVRNQALCCIQDLIIANSLNVVSCRKANGFSYLLQTLADLELPWSVDKAFLLTNPLYRFAESIIEILCYSGVLFSRFDANLLEDITRLAISAQLIHPVIREQLLQCTRDLLRDRNARKLPALTSTFLTEMVVALRDVMRAHEVREEAKFSSQTDKKRTECDSAAGARMNCCTFAEFMCESLKTGTDKDNGAVMLLEAIAHAISEDGARVQVFATAEGFEMLQETFLSEASPSASTLSLWLMFNFIGVVQVNDCTGLIVKLLELERLSATKKMLVLSIFRSWLHDLPESKSSQIRMKLRDGTIPALISIVRTAGPTVAREAFLALGNLITPSEKLKSWLEAKVNFVCLAQVVIESAIKADIAVLEVVMQIANLHTNEHVLARNILEPNSAPVDLICNSVLNIRRPAPRFTTRLRSGIDALVTPSELHSRTEAARFSRRRNMSLTSSTKSEMSTKYHRRTASASSNSSGTELERIMAEEDISQALQRAASAADELAVQASTTASASIEDSDQHLCRFLFRSKEAAQMVLKVLIGAQAAVQRRVVTVLIQVMQLNPANGQIFSRMKGISFVLSVVHQCQPELRVDYLQLLAEMAMYNIMPEETSLLFELAMPSKSVVEESDIDEELRMGIVSVIGQIGHCINPSNFFHCDGRPGWVRVGPIDRFPQAKTGYTMSCWLRVQSFVGEESTLLRWLHASGGNILELYFQRIGANDETSRCLSVRTHSEKAQSSEPFAFNAFNARSFEADGEWHLIVFTQVSRTMSLYVDGNFVQSCSFTSYPCCSGGSVSKERPLVAMFCGDSGDSGGLRGDFSSINLFEGIWDPSSIASLYEKGPLFDDVAKLKSVDAKLFINVHPARCSKGRHHQPILGVVDMDNLRTSSLTDLIEDVVDRFAQSFNDTSPPKKNSFDKKERFRKVEHPDEMGGWIQQHSTRCLQDSINDVGGMKLALRLLAPRNSGLQIPVIRVLTGLLVHWEPNRAAFARLKGYNILLYILSQTELTSELFDVLLEIAAHGELRSQNRPLKEPACALLITDLLPLCSPAVQRTVLRAIEDSNMSSPESLRLWMATEGLRLPIILNFLRTMATSLYPVLVAILQQQACLWTVLETEELLAFVVGDQKAAAGVHCDIMDLLYRQWATCVLPIDQLRTVGGFDMVLCLLDHRLERIRCSGIRALGLLLEDPKGCKAFAKAAGFDAVCRILTPHHPSLDCYTALLQLAMGAFRFESPSGYLRPGGGGSNRGSGVLTSRSEGAPNAIVHSGAIQAVLALLATTADEDLQCAVLGKLRMLLDSDANAEVLLAAGGLDWCRAFLFPDADEPPRTPHVSSAAADEAAGPGPRAAACTLAIVGRLFLRGLFGDVRMLRLKEMGPNGQLKLKDHEAFHLAVINQVCDHFDRDPLVPAAQAPAMLRTVAQLFEPLIEAAPRGDPSPYLQAVRTINRLANHNTDPVRVCLKEARLLELRDGLLIHCLRGPRTRDGAFAIMQGLSFEWVAEKPAFREAHGLSHLLHIFHAFPAERDLQIGVGCVLRNVFGPSAENRKAVLVALEDAEIAQHFFPAAAGGHRRASDQSVEEPSEDGTDAAEESARAVASFLEWYYAPPQQARREAIEARLNRLVAAEEQAGRRGYDRAAERRARRLRAHGEGVARAAAAAAAAFAAAEERRRQRVAAMVAASLAEEKGWTDAFRDRLADGERMWAAIECGAAHAGAGHGGGGPGGGGGGAGAAGGGGGPFAAWGGVMGRAPPPSPMLTTVAGPPRMLSRPPSVASHASSDASDRC